VRKYLARIGSRLADTAGALDASTSEGAPQVDQGASRSKKGAAMDTIRAAGLAACALGIFFYSDVHAATETNGGLLTSVAPPNSRPLDRQSLLAGGEQATYMTSATPAGVISFYRQILPAGGWTVTLMKSQARPAFRPPTAQSIWH
jgi:hypothetical protein